MTIPTFNREKVMVRTRDKIFYIASVMAFLSALLLYTYPSIQMLNKVYRLQELMAQQRELLARQNRLRLRYETLLSRDEMASRAAGLGFLEPSFSQMVYVKKKI